MEKKNVLFLALIVFFGIIFRIWNMPYIPTEQMNFEFIGADSIFEILFENALAPFYPIISNLFSLPYLNTIYPYLSVVFDAVSIIVLYFAGKEFNDKKNENLTGLLSSGFGAISVFLIHLAKNHSMYSLVFMLSAFIILYSVKIINTQNKKYFIPILIFDVVLILTFNLSIFFVVFNLLAIASFYAKKRKTFEACAATFTGLIFLLSPIVPFILRAVNAPDYIAQYSLPFDFSHVFIYLTNMYSPKLNGIDEFELTNFGFWVFVIATSVIGIFLSVKGLLYKRNTTYWAITLFISTFLSMLITCICAKEVLLSKYLITIYPILIVTTANGVPSLKSKTLKIVLPTIFATITIFYIIVNNLVSTNLF